MADPAAGHDAEPETPEGLRGLTTAEAERRLAGVGANDPLAVRRQSAVREFAEPFASPLIVTLLLASGISAYVGEITSAGIIVSMVLMSAALHITQTYRSRRALDRLRGSVAPTATVLRDGAWGELPRGRLVPGDLIRLTAGDLVPADARLVEAKDLHVQQAALTGEALPAEKTAPASVPNDGVTNTNRARALDRSPVSRGPIHFEVALRGRK